MFGGLGSTATVDVVVNNVVKGSENIQAYEGRLANIGVKAGAAGAALFAAAKGAQQLVEMAQQGAGINQMEASFDRMNETIYQTPNLLGQMREAVRGTVKDTELMKGVLTLTAGAGNELAQSMAQASPRLLEIARAASVLNPSLGDTAHMYESLALGIKRSSPMILDNLGIVVKVGDANERMAEQLGKSVEALTAEEKQMALLNEVLERGSVLIEQAGGNIDTQADGWARLTTEIGNATDALLQYTGATLSPMASDAADVGFLGGMTNELKRLENARDSYNMALERGLATSGQVIWTQARLANQYADTQQVYVELANRIRYMDEMQADANQTTERFGDLLDMGATAFYRNVDAATAADNAILNYQSRLMAANGEMMQMVQAAASADAALLNYIGFANNATDATARLARQLGITVDQLRSVGNYLGKSQYTGSGRIRGAVEGVKGKNAIGDLASNLFGRDPDATFGGFAGGLADIRTEADKLQESFAELAAASGDFFMQARGDKDFNAMEELLKAYDKAGRSALELARLGTAGGLFSSDEATTYMNRAAIMQYSQMLAQQGVAPEQAVQMIKQMEESLANGSALAADFFSNIQDGAQPIDIEANTDPMAVAIQTVLDYYNGSHVTIYADIKKSGSDDELESETDDEILEAIQRNGGN